MPPIANPSACKKCKAADTPSCLGCGASRCNRHLRTCVDCALEGNVCVSCVFTCFSCGARPLCLQHRAEENPLACESCASEIVRLEGEEEFKKMTKKELKEVKTRRKMRHQQERLMQKEKEKEEEVEWEESPDDKEKKRKNKKVSFEEPARRKRKLFVDPTRYPVD